VKSIDTTDCLAQNCNPMRCLHFTLFLMVCALRLGADDAPKIGYVDCSSGEKNRLTPVFSNPCVKQPVGTLACGETVTVIGREGPWFKIASPNGGVRYIGATVVSQQKKRFVGLDIPVPPGPYVQDCSAFRPITGKVTPVAIYTPDPQYTEEARKAKIQGTVTLSLTVGTDGRAHDVKVLRPLGYGLDDKAVEAVQSWKWEPALDQGVPIESKMNMDVHFMLFK